MNNIIEEIRKELRLNADGETRKKGERFFKEPVSMYGIKTPDVVRIAKNRFKTLENKDKNTVFNLCETLFSSGMMEEIVIACNWSYNFRKDYRPEDFNVFDRWVKLYVTNWAACDTLCNHTVGTFIEMFPEFLDELKRWAHSENRWVKRASSVSLIIPARKGLFLNDIFAIADILLSDKDDMVQKGYGWALKAASQAHQKDVFDYVMERKATMPRTLFRHAIEKMPKELKVLAMQKG